MLQKQSPEPVKGMTGRERVLTALAHQEPDRVPVDFGSTWITTIHADAYEKLKRHFGIESPTVIMERMQQVCFVDERILQHLDVDTRGVFYGPPELACNQWVELPDNRFRDAWGITWQRPPTSYYYDMIQPALSGDITISDVLNHQWPDPHDPGYTRGLRERVKAQRASTDCALVLNISVWFVQCSQFVRGFEDWFVDMAANPRLMGVLFDLLTDMIQPALPGDITISDVLNHQWPDPHDPGYTRGLRERVKAQRASTDCALVLNISVWFVQCSQFVRGFEDWFVDMAANPRLMGVLFDLLTDIMLGTVGDVLAEVGEWVDVVSVSDDIGMQDRTTVSPEMYRRLIKPRQARAFRFIHDRTPAPLMYHTCGSVYTIMDDLIEIGVDALNPVQTDAACMEPARLKKEFGDRISFWGGINSSRILPWGTPEQVRDEVRRVIRILGPGGGYILNSVHNIQPNVPLENLIGMFEAAREFGIYPLANGG